MISATIIKSPPIKVDVIDVENLSFNWVITAHTMAAKKITAGLIIPK